MKPYKQPNFEKARCKIQSTMLFNLQKFSVYYQKLLLGLFKLKSFKKSETMQLKMVAVVTCQSLMLYQKIDPISSFTHSISYNFKSNPCILVFKPTKLYFFPGMEVCNISICPRKPGAHSFQHPHATSGWGAAGNVTDWRIWYCQVLPFYKSTSEYFSKEICR